MDVEPALVADGEAAEAAHPSQRALDDPPMPAQLSAVLDPAAGEARPDPAAPASIAAAPMVVGLVPVQLVRPATRPARPARHGRDGVEQVLEGHAVVDVGPGQQEASGTPPRPVTRWRLVPGLPRSVGFGPVSSPPFSPGTRRCRASSGRSRPRSRGRGGRAARGGASPRPRPPASRAAGASRSCRSRSPSPAAASPTGCRT